MAATSPEWKPNKRPTSIVALNFSAALDNIFNLGPQGELALSVESKKHEIQSSQNQLQSLESQLQQAEERLKSLQSKHRRMQSESILSRPNRRPRSHEQSASSDSDERSSSDDQQSPTFTQ